MAYVISDECALTPVLQKQSIQLNNFIHNKKAAASAVAFFCSSLFFLYAIPMFSFSLFFGCSRGFAPCHLLPPYCKIKRPAPFLVFILRT